MVSESKKYIRASALSPPYPGLQGFLRIPSLQPPAAATSPDVLDSALKRLAGARGPEVEQKTERNKSRHLKSKEPNTPWILQTL